MSEVRARPPDAPIARPDRKTSVPDRQQPAYWSRAGLIEGARAMLPLLPGQFAFGMAFGALAAQKGFTLVEAVAMTGIVYAGMSQFVILQSWPDALTVSTVTAVMLLTATVNARFFLMSASLRPWFSTLPVWQAYPPLTILTDGGWLNSMRYRDRGGADASFFLGGQILSYVSWTFAALPGYLLAERLTDPKAYGVDLLMPAFFAALLIPSYRGLERTIPWVISGIVATTVAWLTSGYWFIIAGAVAGSVSAAFILSEGNTNGR
ncbi:AzlC family ABC transporter permease [Bradyrhizobium sp. LHD-71]|uniref:AzlC family ABC transporter permease n=1 Tax=Bradyrhizobium sp. LHD-71 TaxID=3072141 RepID=UPI00280FDA77|nr:AzlC family ABC transporter permease [Bradyrhizobium sp. LHD-71]MDQ8728976.1 AzlC family ABC transporter permease [Bradyrhizobium sp. LHD-71]